MTIYLCIYIPSYGTLDKNDDEYDINMVKSVILDAPDEYGAIQRFVELATVKDVDNTYEDVRWFLVNITNHEYPKILYDNTEYADAVRKARGYLEDLAMETPATDSELDDYFVELQEDFVIAIQELLNVRPTWIKITPISFVMSSYMNVKSIRTKR